MGSRRDVRCGYCGSLERTRALKLILDYYEFPPSDARVLHFAPEAGLTRWLGTRGMMQYDAFDLEPQRYRHTAVKKFDLTKDASSLPSDYYHLIIHSHVMEHVPCNLAYVFYFLHRALRSGGLHVFCIPFSSGYYDECFGPLSKDEAVRRFGQDDHVRKFGRNDIERHVGSFLRLPAGYSLYDYCSAEKLDACNIPESERKGWNASTILVLRRNDYLLASLDQL